MKVTGWTFWGNPIYLSWFDSAPRPRTDAEVLLAKQTIAKALRENGYRFTGTAHQMIRGCTPVIDDTWCFEVSMRMWGEIMQMAYPETTGSYADWAWLAAEKEVFPLEEAQV